jgi:hypothetical protein
MSLKPENELGKEELNFFSELGWLATLSVSVATFAPYILDIFG